MKYLDEISEKLQKREGISKNDVRHTIDDKSVWFRVPEKVSLFTGREDEMERLHESIKGQNVEKNGRNEITVITALRGLGGIGKTTLAIHYAWKYFSNKFYFNVIWINAETIDTVEKSLYGLADAIELTTIGTQTLIELASRIYKHLEQTTTLFVFDNVEQHDSVKPYLPIKLANTTRQYVLITSRNRVWNHKTDLFVLDVFPEKESVEFLKSYLRLETDVEYESAKEIARGLQNLPLAIRQASVYIEKVCSDDHQSVAQVMSLYLELLNTDSKLVLDFKCDLYEKTIFNTWKITLEKIKRMNYLAVRIMQIISYFNSDNIPIQLLENIPQKGYFQRVVDSMLFNNTDINESSVFQAVKLLSQYSMLTKNNQFSMSVHSLVQKVIRKDVERFSRHTILDEAVRTIEKPLKSMTGGDFERNCLLHAISLSKHIRSNHLEHGYSRFLDFVNSKQNDSIDMHTKRLCVLLEESKFDETEESFYKTRNDYFSEPNGREAFTVRFINCVCKRIHVKLKYFSTRNENFKLRELNSELLDSTEQNNILELIGLCSKLLVGFKLSLSSSKDRTDFRISADLLKSTAVYTDLTNIQYCLAETSSRMYRILFDYFKRDRNFLALVQS